MMNSILLRALQGKNDSGRPPIWMMRQAGRYLPAYRALREKHELLDLFRSEEGIVEVTKLPFQTAPFDAAILFADILMLLDCFGKRWDVISGRGPVVENPVRTAEEVEALQLRNVEEELPFWRKAIQTLVRELNVPLLGFCGAPFTVASYLVEGGTSKDMLRSRTWMARDPATFCKLLDKLAEGAIELLRYQIDAGVHAVQVFDSWANGLSPAAFERFSLPYLRKIQEGVADTGVPVIHFCRGSAAHAESLVTLKPHAIGVDWSVELGALRRTVGPGTGLQGNFDPFLLFGDRKTVRREAQRILAQMEGDPSFIFNLGHGVLPKTPVESVQELVSTVQS